MPTAIVRGVSEDGFIIAADGRYVNTETNEVLGDSFQKIFQVGLHPIAYTTIGAVSFDAKNGGIGFDFLPELQREASMVDRTGTVMECAKKICMPIYENLRRACREQEIDLNTGLISPGKRGQQLLGLFFDGYSASGEAGNATVRFFHENGEIGEPEFEEDLNSRYHGSTKVQNAMLSSGKFDKFRRELPPEYMQTSDDLNGWITAALNYIAACSSTEGQKLDPETCLTIGGHVHIARITPRLGFRWIRAPKSI